MFFSKRNLATVKAKCKNKCFTILGHQHYLIVQNDSPALGEFLLTEPFSFPSNPGLKKSYRNECFKCQLGANFYS